ncbi:Armadillo-type fold [Pseudocohnilembus persalinus]|uniref:Armadillo-type fold n=1 Tax=Pseudocohnilembus persalinus TaxID=266149 RepID=A0A0V0QY86_PSEPJ|nr:Armadillo-type fold [Pseudocohnilembus persalinus]|eukprot:KRX07202.1 Armadillo-type fold [Pseudocohnilembus persalinus]
MFQNFNNFGSNSNSNGFSNNENSNNFFNQQQNTNSNGNFNYSNNNNINNFNNNSNIGINNLNNNYQNQNQNQGQSYNPLEEQPLNSNPAAQYSLSEQSIQHDQAKAQQNQKSFTAFENLPNYPPETDMNAVAGRVLECFKSNSWKEQFDALDNLRVFNKYYYSSINEIFGQFGGFIKETVESEKTQLVKNCLLLIKEIYIMQQQMPNIVLHNQFTETFVPILLNKSNHTNSDIKNIAQSALQDFIAFYYGKEESVLAACQGCFNNIPQIKVYALKLLNQILKMQEQAITKLSEDTLQKLMKTLAEMLNGKQKQNVLSEGIQVCQTIGQIIGQENYINLMNVTLNVQEQQNMQKNIVEDSNKRTKKKENQSRQSLCQFLKNNNYQKQQHYTQKDPEFVLSNKQQVVAQQLEMQQQYRNQNQQQQFGGNYFNNMQNIANNFQQQNQQFM